MKSFKRRNQINLPTYRINDEIKTSSLVRLVGENVEGGIMPIYKAKDIAKSMGLDLIEINRETSPTIVKIASYEKMMYEMKKSLKKAKHSAQKPLKEVQLSANIAKHDLETKANKAKEFIEDGSKVKVVLSLKGREMSRRDESKKSILEFIELMSEVANPESDPKDEGNRTIVILKKK